MAHPPTPTAPITLRAWKAARAGGSMTVHGTDIATGAVTKITNIESIQPPLNAAAHHVRAIAANGIEHVLTFAL